MTDWLVYLLFGGLGLYAVYLYNLLVRDRQRTLAGWSDIEVQLKRRHDLVPKLVEAVRRYAAYEQATLDRVTRQRSAAEELRAAPEQGRSERDLSAGLVSIFALQEAYPELKADQSFLQLQTDISAVEADIQFARRYYNGAVRNLNTRIDSFPDLLLARLLGYRPAQYFEFDQSAAR